MALLVYKYPLRSVAEVIYKFGIFLLRIFDCCCAMLHAFLYSRTHLELNILLYLTLPSFCNETIITKTAKCVSHYVENERDFRNQVISIWGLVYTCFMTVHVHMLRIDNYTS